MSPRLTIRRVHRDRRVTRPSFVTRCASTDARVVCFEILRGGGAPESFQRGASGRRRGQLVRYLAGVVRRRADER